MRRLSGSVILALAATACSSPPPVQTGSKDGGTTGTPQPAYWGLADQSCWHLDDGSKANSYTVSVAKDTTTIAGVTTYHLALKENGFPVRDDWFEVKPDSLVLWRRTDDPMNQSPIFSMYDPAPVILQKDLPTGQNQDSHTTAKVSTGSMANTMVELDFSSVNEADEPVTALGMAQTATHYLVTSSDMSGMNEQLDQYWLTPNVGIVQLQLNGMQKPVALVSVDANVASSNCVPQ